MNFDFAGHRPHSKGQVLIFAFRRGWQKARPDPEVFAEVFGGGFARNYPNPLKIGVSITGGWINQCAKPLGADVDEFLTGLSGSASGFVILGGDLVYSPGFGTATVVGFGAGTNVGGVNGGVMRGQGNTGLGGW